MKWWNRRQPEDLVGSELAAAARRSALAPDPNYGDLTWDEHFRASMRPLGNPAAMVPLIVQAPSTGGWCSPSETIYDMLSLPEVQMQRGGIRFLTQAERERVAMAGVLTIPEDVTFPTYEEDRLR